MAQLRLTDTQSELTTCESNKLMFRGSNTGHLRGSYKRQRLCILASEVLAKGCLQSHMDPITQATLIKYHNHFICKTYSTYVPVPEGTL